MIYISREEHFNAAHKLYNPNWTEEKNIEVFGPCANANWHGHNFNLIVTVKGTPDPETGFVVDLKKLSRLIRSEVIDQLDHKNLNLDTEEFKSLNPTAENIAVVCWNLLRPKIDENKNLSVVLYETPRNFVEYSGE